MHGPHRLDSFGAILSGLAKRLGLESRLVELRLQHQWRDIVGEPTGSHTWPDHIRFKKLYLVVRNSVWLQQLTFLKPAMLAKLHDEMGPELITDIVFRVGEMPASRASERVPSAAASPLVPETEIAEVLSHTARIQDQTLRERLTEVISKYPAPAPSRPEEGR